VRNGNVTFLAFILLSGRDDLWLYAGIGGAVGIYLFYRGFRTLQRRRLILDTPASKIRSASMGLVEVSGLAAGPHTIPAPVTGVPCYFYRTIAWQFKQAGKNKQWQKVAEDSLHVPFFLDDNTGKVLVDPQGAELDIHRDFHEEYSGSFFGGNDDLPVNVSNFLARHGITNDHKLRVDEYCIKPKNALFVLGTLATNPGIELTGTPVRSDNVGFNLPILIAQRPARTLEANFNISFQHTVVVNAIKDGAAQEVIRLSSDGKPESASEMTQQGKIAAALTKAGISSPAAWAVAGVATGTATAPSNGGGVATGEAPSDFETRPPVVLMKGDHQPAFFISWRSQREILKSLGWQSTAMIWGGPVLTLGCLYYVLAHFGWL
jgi:E3 Ubiquitin ligase